VPPGGRVDDIDEADRRDVTLARVVHGDREKVVPEAETGERVDPVVAGEIGDHRDEPSTPADDRHPADRGDEVRAAEALRRRR
jgi:hypothetical protein